MTPEELAVILDKHGKWLRREDGGVRANLSGAKLSEANLSEADLSWANLFEANLSGARIVEHRLRVNRLPELGARLEDVHVQVEAG